MKLSRLYLEQRIIDNVYDDINGYHAILTLSGHNPFEPDVWNQLKRTAPGELSIMIYDRPPDLGTGVEDEDEFGDDVKLCIEFCLATDTRVIPVLAVYFEPTMMFGEISYIGPFFETDYDGTRSAEPSPVVEKAIKLARMDLYHYLHKNAGIGLDRGQFELVLKTALNILEGAHAYLAGMRITDWE